MADVAKEIGLATHLGILDKRTSEKTSDKALGTIMEALMGAIHEDSGKDCEAVRSAMHQMGLHLPEWYTSQSPILPNSFPGDARPNRPGQVIKGTNQKARLKLERAQVFGDRRAAAARPRGSSHIEQNICDDEDADQEGPKDSDSQVAESQATDFADISLDALAAARESFEDLDLEHEDFEDDDSSHDLPEDADIKQGDLGYLDTHRTRAEHPTTDQGHHEGEGTLVGASDGELSEIPAVEPNSLVRRVLWPPDLEWHGHHWVPQHCQITLDVALSKKSQNKKYDNAQAPSDEPAISPLAELSSSIVRPGSREMRFKRIESTREEVER